MAVVIPQVVTEDRASGAQVIDGSLKFDKDKLTYLSWTPSSSGNRNNWTISCWIKRGKIGVANQRMFHNSTSNFSIRFGSDVLQWTDAPSGANGENTPTAVLRDTGWYHLVFAWDSSAGVNGNAIYLNGQLLQYVQTGGGNPNTSSAWNVAGEVHTIGANQINTGRYYDGMMTQCYFVDGQTLGPEYFGYTDPLTNTWRPKKLTTWDNPNNGTTWSSSLTGARTDTNFNTHAFDGSLTTKAGTSAVGGTLTFTPPSAIPYNSSIEVYTYWGAANDVEVSLNGGAAVTDPGNQWTTIATGSGSITSMTFTGTTNSGEVSAIRVDGVILIDGVDRWGTNGFYLPMDGNSPIGRDKSGIVTPNNGTIWSSGKTGSDLSGYPATNGFNGNTSDYFFAAANQTTTFTFSPAISGTKFEIFMYGGGGFPAVTVNGTDAGTAAGAWVDVTSQANGSLSTIACVGGSSNQAGFSAVRVDNHILIDGQIGNSWTPVNFGGSNTIEKATGAKPILNTLGGTIARPGVFGSEVSKYYAVTVPGGIGGGFYLDGTQKPALNLIRGATYTFDQSDSSNSSHPLVFGTTAEGNNYSDGVTTNGTPGSAGAYTKITVPHNAPDTLYYHCSNHSGMGNSTSQTTDETKADPYAWKNVLALPLVGSANDVSNQINSGSSTKTITVTNAVASSAQSNFYGGSYYFDGTGDYLSVASTSDFAFGTGDFAIEGYLYNPTGGQPDNNNVIDARNGSGGWKVDLNTSDYLNFYSEVAGAYVFSASTHYIAPGKWTHFAVVRSSGTAHLFIDGVLKESVAHTSNYSTSLSAIIGARYTVTTQYLSGYLQDIRVYKGVAKYTSNFIPASTNPDILPDTPSGVSGGSKLTKITDGAVSFDGSGDSLSTAWSSDFEFGTGDFTIETFVYYRSDTGTAIAWGSDLDNRFDFGCVSSNELRLFIRTGATTSVNITVADGIPLKKWIHIAAVRNTTSGTTKIFIDGIERASSSASYTTPTDTSNGVDIGRRRYGSTTAHHVAGFISNLRVIKGTALYTSNFTPPTRTLTNVTNTKLLCCQSNEFDTLATVSPGTYSNPGIVWSAASNVSGDVRSQTDNYGPPKMFNGIIGNESNPGAICFAPYSSDSRMTWTSPVSLTGLTSLRLYVDKSGTGAGYLRVNGNNYDSSVTDGWVTIPESSLSTIQIGYTGGVNTATGIAAIEVNGTVLTDNLIGKALAKGSDDSAATNFNPFTTDINAVRGQETGYATLNPLDKGTSSTLSDGNLKFSGVSLAHRGVRSSIRPTIKVYAEMVVYNNETGFGFATGTTGLDSSTLVSGKWVIYNNQLRSNGSSIASITTLAVGDLIQVAYDPDSNKAWIGRNNLWYDSSGGYTGNPATGANATFTISEDIFIYTHSYNAYDTTTNFGQKPFKFPPPDGFQPLNAANVRPSTVVARPDQYVGVTTYSGSSGNVVVDDLNFKPDAVWIKQRNASGFTDDHVLVDSVRGRAKSLYPNATYSENTSDADKDLISFDINGFTLGPTQQSAVNRGSSGNYVAWTWKAGGNSNTFNIDDVGYASAAAAGLAGGDMSPTGASVGTKQGFSILKFTAPSDSGTKTISHGLSQTPEFYIFKETNRSSTAWYIFHHSVCDTNAKFMRFDTTTLQSGAGNVWGNLPTSSLISIQNGSLNAVSSQNILYAWHSVPGLQKFGSYEGNQNADGPFVELGFRPSVLMVKRTAGANANWYIMDTKTQTINPVVQALEPNTPDSTNTASVVNFDFLSNGFKVRGTDGDINAASTTYIYAAWAEAPSFNLYGAQSNAR